MERVVYICVVGILLSNIHSPKDLRKLSKGQLPNLAKELREAIIDVVATKEGHLGASLGVVELTIALHYCFDTPYDLLVWDVGHQAYGHKILTERKKRFFETNRQFGGLSGFPNRDESIYDPFGTGHSSTSISAVLGMAMAAGIQKNTSRNHIAVIGDASIVSGMAFEALNHLGDSDANVWVILNDNAMGIDPSVGVLKDCFCGITTASHPFADLFKLRHSGPIDGHSFDELFESIEKLRVHNGPKFLHLRTVKGKGLTNAERDQIRYHAPGKFNKTTGQILPHSDDKPKPQKYQDVFGKTLVEIATTNDRIVGITPAMPTGTSLKYMIETFPKRCFDVGIAEQHAVTFAAGLATQGMIPYCAFYSTFLQRAYDQVIHDVALQKLPVIFCIDRAGIVGQDGATHHGVFDMAILQNIPNMIIATPRDEIALRNMLYSAQYADKPTAIRYPRGVGEIVNWRQPLKRIPIGKGECLRKGNKIAMLSIGKMVSITERAIAKVKHLKVAHYDMRFLKPLDNTLLKEILENHPYIITLEDGVLSGGLHTTVVTFAQEYNFKNTIRGIGVPDTFVPHGRVEELYKLCKMSVEDIVKAINVLNV